MPSNHRAWRPVSPIQTMVVVISQVFHIGACASGMQPYLTMAMAQAA
jgi:hypothetical protein